MRGHTLQSHCTPVLAARIGVILFIGPDCSVMKWDIYGPFELTGARNPDAPEPLL